MRKYIILAQLALISTLLLLIRAYGVTKLNVVSLVLLLLSTALNLWEAHKHAKR